MRASCSAPQEAEGQRALPHLCDPIRVFIPSCTGHWRRNQALQTYPGSTGWGRQGAQLMAQQLQLRLAGVPSFPGVRLTPVRHSSYRVGRSCQARQGMLKRKKGYFFQDTPMTATSGPSPLPPSPVELFFPFSLFHSFCSSIPTLSIIGLSHCCTDLSVPCAPLWAPYEPFAPNLTV